MAYVRKRLRATPELKAFVGAMVRTDLRVKAAVDRLKMELAEWDRSPFVHISVADARIIIKALEG